MSEELPVSILTELQNSKGYEAAFFTSYSFDITFFENKIKSILLLNKIKKIGLYIDYEKFVEAIKNNRNYSFGKQYNNYLISIKGAFHPKLILLLGKDKAKLIISSANLKKSNYLNNIEVFNVFEYNKEHTEYASIINDAIKVFLQLESVSFEPLNGVLKKERFIDNDLHDYLTNYKIKNIDSDKTTYLINNLDKPIIQQVKEIIDEDISKIIISSPFFDSDLGSIKEIKNIFSCNDIELYIQNKNNSFPIDFNIKYKIVENDKINVFNVLKREAGCERIKDGFYHAKVIEFVGKTKGYVLYGSANCSKNALLRTFKNNGNIECDILTEIKKDQIYEYFNNLKIEKSTNLISEIKNEIRSNDEEIKFLFGIKDSKTTLYFQITEEKIISIMYVDKKCEYSLENNILIVEINNDLISKNNEALEISIKTDIGISVVSFWYIDKKELSRFRDDNVQHELQNLDPLSDENYETILRKIYDILKDENIFKYDPSIANKESGFLKNDDSFEDDEFEYEVEEVDFGYEEKQRRFSNIYNILVQNWNDYYKKFPIKRERSKTEDNTSGTILADIKKNNEKRSIPNIRKIGNYLKRLCRKTLKESNSFTISDKTFVNLSGFILNIIYRFHYGKVDSVFLSNNEVLEIKLIIVIQLLKRSRINREDYIKEALINSTIRLIVEVGYLLYLGKINYDLKNLKEIVTEINELFNIQDELDDIIKFTDFPEVINNIGYNPISFAENLFPSKTKTKLLKEIKEYFAAHGIDVREDKSIFKIFLIGNRLNTHMNGLSKNILNMIMDYLLANNKNVSIIEITLLKEKQVLFTYEIKIVLKKEHINEVNRKDWSGITRYASKGALYIPQKQPFIIRNKW